MQRQNIIATFILGKVRGHRILYLFFFLFDIHKGLLLSCFDDLCFCLFAIHIS